MGIEAVEIIGRGEKAESHVRSVVMILELFVRKGVAKGHVVPAIVHLQAADESCCEAVEDGAGIHETQKWHFPLTMVIGNRRRLEYKESNVQPFKQWLSL